MSSLELEFIRSIFVCSLSRIVSRHVETKVGNVKVNHIKVNNKQEKKSNAILFHYKRLKTNAIKEFCIGRESSTSNQRKN